MYFTSKLLPLEIISALQEVDIDTVSGKSKNSSEPEKVWIIRIPQLDRQHYNTFKKILEEIHGEWDRSLQGHVFDFDPTDVLAEVVSVGKLPQRQPHDAFFTPREALEHLLDWGSFYCLTAVDGKNVEPHKCLEPEAGQGHIAEVLRELYPGIDLSCCEIDSFNRAILKKKGFRVIAGDFLTVKIEPIYDWVVMNPPFNGKCGDYIDHINKAFDEALVPRGRLLAIVPTSFLTSTTKRVEEFRNKIAVYGEWARLPENSFVKSGTQVETCMIKVEKYTAEDLERLESEGQVYGVFDAYTGPIVRDISSESELDKRICRIVEAIKEGTINSEKKVLAEIISAADRWVRHYNERYEASFRWDDFTKPRVAQYFWEDIVEGYFDNRSPFEPSNPDSTKSIDTRPVQLSLFG